MHKSLLENQGTQAAGFTSMRKNNNMNDEHQANGATARRSVRRLSKFKNYVKAHRTVIGNEIWYRDDPPDLGPQFTAKRTSERCQILDKASPPGREKE